MKKLFLVIVLLCVCMLVFADKPTFQQPVGGGSWFGQYTGTVKKIYVNNSNQILLYFDTSIDLNDTTGYEGQYSGDVTQGAAAIILINEYPDFAKFFYSTALTAQSLGKRITVQMRGIFSGYVKIDRVWMDE